MGMEKFFLDGTMLITMKPLLHEIPLYGGVHISFVNPPKLKFKFLGTGVELARRPGLAKSMEEVAVKTFNGMFTLPNSMFIPTVPADKIDIQTLKFAAPPLFCARIEVLQLLDMPGPVRGKFFIGDWTRYSSGKRSNHLEKCSKNGVLSSPGGIFYLKSGIESRRGRISKIRDEQHASFAKSTNCICIAIKVDMYFYWAHRVSW